MISDLKQSSLDYICILELNLWWVRIVRRELGSRFTPNSQRWIIINALDLCIIYFGAALYLNVLIRLENGFAVNIANILCRIHAANVTDCLRYATHSRRKKIWKPFTIMKCAQISECYTEKWFLIIYNCSDKLNTRFHRTVSIITIVRDAAWRENNNQEL